MSNRAYSASESDASESSDNVYCIFLHIVEGIGLHPREAGGSGDVGGFGERHKDKIILNASLNGVKFEVEGHSTETATIFNSNCIWECDLGDIKRMKTDNRPVKLECFSKSSGHSVENSPRKIIGSLLLPIRGVLTVANLRNLQLKLHWHKLSALTAAWRQHRPEIYLLLIIVKKSLIENGQFESFLGKKKILPNDVLSPKTSETALMLQSQSNVYVQLLEQVGLIQVGNNPDIDCDIFNVTLTFKQVKHLEKLLEAERSNVNGQTNVFVFHYDFLGSASHLEMFVNASDCYTINEKISLSFKSSLRSLRMYFQRIFYIPINLYLNGIAIANYRFDFSKFLPDDLYFNVQKNWTKSGIFNFDRLHKILSPRAKKPCVDFIFSIQLLSSYAKKNNHCEVVAFNETFVSYNNSNNNNNYNNNKTHNNNNKIDEKTNGAAGDMSDCYRNLEFKRLVPSFERNFSNLEEYEKNFSKTSAESLLKDDLFGKSSEEFVKEASSEKEIRLKRMQTIALSTEDLLQRKDICVGTATTTADEQRGSPVVVELKTIAVNTDELTDETPPLQPDTEELTLKIVQELEDWKAQQMESFLVELERKESLYFYDLDKQWQQRHNILAASLEAKIAKCTELNENLEKTQNELNANALKNKESLSIAETVKRDIEHNYAQKFQMLDMKMQRLKVEMQQKGTTFEIQTKELHIDNARLEQDKANLNERIFQLEKQLAAMENTHLSADQLKTVLADLRIQSDRFSDVEKSKNYYKQQWAKVTREMHKLKMQQLKQQDKSMRDKQNNGFDICLEEILYEEQDALNSDRSELKSIKELLFLASDTSDPSTCELDEEH